MSDREIRVLERAVAEGDELAREPLLRARVRAGFVSQERLDAASALGDELAPRAGGVDRWRGSSRWRHNSVDLVGRRFIILLPRRRVVTMACDWAEPTLGAWESRYPELTQPRVALWAARKWVAESSGEKGSDHVRWAERRAEQARFAGDPQRVIPGWEAARSCQFAASTASSSQDAMREWWSQGAEIAADGAVTALARSDEERRSMRAEQCRRLVLELLTPD